MERGNSLKRLEHKVLALWLAGWVADYPDPDSFLRLAAQQYHTGQLWKDETYADLVQGASRTLDHAERTRLHRRAQELLVEGVPLISLPYVRGNYLLMPWIADNPYRRCVGIISKMW